MDKPGPFCPKCGAKNSSDAVFCYNCGNNLTYAQQAAAAANGPTELQNPYNSYNTGGQSVPFGQEFYPKASLGSRFLAHIVDSLISSIPLIPGIVLMESRRTEDLGIVLLLIAGIWSVFYGVCKDGFKGGQSYGKKLNGLMVVHLTTNQPCTKVKSLLRTLIFAIPYIGGLVEIIMVLANGQGRRLGDMLANTQVIAVNQYRR